MLITFFINTSNSKCYCIFIFAVIFDRHLYFSTVEYKIITISFILNNQQIKDECLLQQFFEIRILPERYRASRVLSIISLKTTSATCIYIKENAIEKQKTRGSL